MINHLHSMGFVWFTGVVEDRFDPLEVGRVRVRAHGFHTQDKTDIPTEDLFWAHTLLPTTSPSNSNVSETPRLIEGTTVMGFFVDGPDCQQPVIMGSIPGIPVNAANTEEGFYDPTGNYPRDNRLDEPDISRLARGEKAEDNPVLSAVRDSRTTDIPTAKAPDISSVADNLDGTSYEHGSWNQPNPRFGGEEESDRDYEEGSKYGFNQVTESESGHYEEVDDTPGAERLCRTHRTGTFEEILADGTRVTKVVGSDYEVVVGNKKVFVRGSCDVTINGDAKLLINGDKYEEVTGNYHLLVRGDRRTKIIGNDAKEVLSDENTQINGNQNIRVSLERNDVVTQNEKKMIGGTLDTTIQGNESRNNVSKYDHIINESAFMFSRETFDFGSVNRLSVASQEGILMRSIGDMTLQIDASFLHEVEGNITATVGGNVDETVSGNFTENVSGTIDSTASGDMTLNGSTINLN